MKPHPLAETLTFGPLKMSHTEHFDKTLKSLNDDRGAVYGHPADDFGRAAALIEVVDECKDPIIRQNLRMLCVKIARLIETPDHVDSWVDIGGYSRCGVMIIDRRREAASNL